MFSQWARKELERGDLNVVSELAKGWNTPSPGRLARLGHRGFVIRRENEKLSVSLKGRLALWVRRLSAKP